MGRGARTTVGLTNSRMCMGLRRLCLIQFVANSRMTAHEGMSRMGCDSADISYAYSHNPVHSIFHTKILPPSKKYLTVELCRLKLCFPHYSTCLIAKRYLA